MHPRTRGKKTAGSGNFVVIFFFNSLSDYLTPMPARPAFLKFYVIMP